MLRVDVKGRCFDRTPIPVAPNPFTSFGSSRAEGDNLKHVQLFTHEAWFGICPVYAADLDSDCPHLTPRVENMFFEGLFLVSHWAFLAYFLFADVMAHLFRLDWEPGFPIFVTGELPVPYRYEYEEGDEPLL
jgi:hypothetical protein